MGTSNFLSIGHMGKSLKRAERIKRLTDTRMAQVASDEMRLGGCGRRNSERLHADVPAPIVSPPVSTVVQQPLQAPRVQPSVNQEQAKVAFHAYHNAANGADRGKAFVNFGKVVGEIPANTGLQSEEQFDRVSKILHDEISFFKWDRANQIQRAPRRAPRTF